MSKRVRSVALLLGSLAVALLGAVTGCAPRASSTDIEIGIPTEVKRGLELDWKRVNGADGYRLVFSRMTGTPVCTLFVEQMKKPSYLLVRDSLPAGLLARWELLLEIRGMRHGEPMDAAGMRPLKTP